MAYATIGFDVIFRDELVARREAFWALVEREGCEVGLVFGAHGHHEHFRYLTNFAPVLGDAWAVLTGPDEVACTLTFDWQFEEARERSGIERWGRELELQTGSVAVAGLERMAFTALPDAELVDIGDEAAALRRHKSAAELELLREAARIADQAFAAVRDELWGLTEHEVAARLTYEARRRGAEWAFPPGVTSGPGAVGIRMPTARTIGAGDTVMIDIGPEVEGYQADATRTYLVGSPSAEQRRAWDAVRVAHEAALEQCRPGVPCRNVHAAAARVIEDAGYRLPHRIGHGIGLATSFEWPSLDVETAELQPGMTICVEPAVFVRGLGSFKLEDDLVITDDGHELLTRAPASWTSSTST
jgi:Xaa-Pro aminopeptidase